MNHPAIAGQEDKIVERNAYRAVWWGLGWLSADDPGFEGDPSGPTLTAAQIQNRAIARQHRETIGAGTDQARARTENARWLTLIRSASAPVTPSWFRALGGDVTDACAISGNRVMNIGSDLFAGTTIVNDQYVGDALPFRSAAILESTPGTFGSQLYKAGNTGPWIEPDQGTYPNTHYWPIACEPDPANADRVIVGCWLVRSAPTATAPYGTLLGTHFVSISLAFGGAVAGNASVTVPAGRFILKFWRDATHIYSLWESFHPLYSPGVEGVPIYGQGSDISGHHTRVYLARQTHAQFNSGANLTWWNGTTWVSQADTAVWLTDTEGDPLRGDGDITRVADGSFRWVGHTLIDTHVDVARSESITGPYEPYCRVPVPGMGGRVHGGVQIGQFARFVEHVTADAETSVVGLALNTLGTSGSFAGRNIRRYAPQFVVVPHY